MERFHSPFTRTLRISSSYAVSVWFSSMINFKILKGSMKKVELRSDDKPMKSAKENNVLVRLRTPSIILEIF